MMELILKLIGAPIHTVLPGALLSITTEGVTVGFTVITIVLLFTNDGLAHGSLLVISTFT